MYFEIAYWRHYYDVETERVDTFRQVLDFIEHSNNVYAATYSKDYRVTLDRIYRIYAKRGMRADRVLIYSGIEMKHLSSVERNAWDDFKHKMRIESERDWAEYKKRHPVKPRPVLNATDLAIRAMEKES